MRDQDRADDSIAFERDIGYVGPCIGGISFEQTATYPRHSSSTDVHAVLLLHVTLDTS